MGDVVPFLYDRKRPLLLGHLRAYRDDLLALVGRLLATVDDARTPPPPDVEQDIRASLLMARDRLSAIDLEPATWVAADAEQLGRVAVSLLRVGCGMTELTKAMLVPMPGVVTPGERAE